MLKTLFDKVKGEQSKTPTKKPDKTGLIVKSLSNALNGNEKIELYIDDSMNSRSTYLVDSPPTFEEFIPEEGISEENESTIREKYEKALQNYKAGDFFKKATHLLILQPLASKGAPSITTENVLYCEYYLGSSKCRFKTHLIEEVTMNDMSCLKLAFPETMGQDQGRQFHRAKLKGEHLGFIYFKLVDSDLLKAELMDLSAGGASFEVTPTLPELAVGLEIAVALSFEGRDRVTVKATIRNIQTLSYKDENGKPIKKKVAGIQFHLDNRHTAAIIEEEVVKLQRTELQKFRER